MKPVLAGSGEDALALLRAASKAGKDFQLLLVDAVMPDMDGFSLVEHIRDERPGDDMLIMMLSSSGQKEALARCRSLGVSLYLTKPVRQSQLFRFITTALSKSASSLDSARISPRRINETASRPLSILLAEDNAVNQRVASSLLERRGHSVVCASDGHEALARFNADNFDVVLMDIQMPGMSGFEVTAEIRRREAASGSRVPIIALTARAMKGDREECLAAGMDGYISKPIRAAELYEAIAQLCDGAHASAPVVLSMNSSSEDVIDGDLLLNLTGGDRGLLRELAVMFASESSLMIGQLRDAIASGDNATVESVAHSLKGSSGTLTGYSASKTAAELESLGRTHQAHAGGPLCSRLEAELGALNQALGSFTLRTAV
jgi:CheY-like chemotaxis protein/HPt (histidine-containing phosphotransfer) domain-containing protein